METKARPKLEPVPPMTTGKWREASPPPPPPPPLTMQAKRNLVPKEIQNNALIGLLPLLPK